MPNLTDGDSAPAEDTWLRNLTNRDHIKKDGKVHHSALRGKCAPPDPEPVRPWSHELSGRLLSRVADVRADGEAAGERARENLAAAGKAVPSKVGFVGVAWAKVDRLRHQDPKTDVVFTPTSNDSAHSDFVVFGTEDDLPEIYDFLQERLTVAPPDTVSNLLAIANSAETATVSATASTLVISKPIPD